MRIDESQSNSRRGKTMKTQFLYQGLIGAALAGAALLSGGNAAAQAAPAGPDVTPTADAAETKPEIIIVTGTRTTGLTAADSPAPIDVLDIGTLSHTGQPDLAQALAQNVPSFTAQAFGGDT